MHNKEVLQCRTPASHEPKKIPPTHKHQRCRMEALAANAAFRSCLSLAIFSACFNNEKHCAVLCCAVLALCFAFAQVDLVDLAPVVPPWKKRAGAPLSGADGGGMKRLSVELLPHARAS